MIIKCCSEDTEVVLFIETCKLYVIIDNKLWKIKKISEAAEFWMKNDRI